jgi:hypothetical protein
LSIAILVLLVAIGLALLGGGAAVFLTRRS